ncbi:MAG: hypothetical protein Q9225_007681 [Loekoesia sp. 1 TL-2023]
MDTAAIPPEVLNQNRGPDLVAVTWVFAFLALVVVGIKIWTRFRILHQSGLEDLFVFLAWVCAVTMKDLVSDQSQVLSLVYGALLTASVHYGLGRHHFAMDPQNIATTVSLYTVAVPFGVLSKSLPTLALAILLQKILEPKRLQTWLLYGVPVLHVITKIVDVVLIYTSCPPSTTPLHPKPTTNCFPTAVAFDYLYFTTCMIARELDIYPCMDIVTYHVSIGFAAFTDTFLAVVPMVAFWKLQLKPKAKITLLLLFSTTTIAAVCALVCVAYVPKRTEFQDFTYSSITYLIWAVIEGDAIIISACIPGLRPFVKYLSEKKTHHKRRPKPLQLDKQINTISDASVLSTPVSARRMTPRSSGSVSHGLYPPNCKAYRQQSLAPIESNTNDLEWQGLGVPDWGIKDDGHFPRPGRL